MKIYVYIMCVVISILFLGVILVYEQSLVLCKTDSINFCAIKNILVSFPAGIGSFCGIFISAFLAYHFSIMKSKSDDLKKDNNQKVVDACQLVAQARRCLSNLSSIKHEYYEQIKDKDEIVRGLLFPYTINDGHNFVEPDAFNFIFLLDLKIPNNHGDIVSRIQDAFCKYNDAIVLFKKRNEIARDVHSVLNKCQNGNYQDRYFGCETINLREFSKQYGVNEFLNYLLLTERFFILVDDAISAMVSISIDVPILVNEYLLAHGCKSRVPIVKYDNSSSLIHNEVIKVDVNSGLESLWKIINHKSHSLNFKY